MLSRSSSGDGHVWNSTSDIQLGSLWGGGGGSYLWKRVRKKRGSDEPPEPPLVTGLVRTTLYLSIALNFLLYWLRRYNDVSQIDVASFQYCHPGAHTHL